MDWVWEIQWFHGSLKKKGEMNEPGFWGDIVGGENSMRMRWK